MLDRSSLSKGFEHGPKLWGIDLFLLLAVLVAMSVLNFLIGNLPGGFFISFALPLSIGGMVHFKSRNKPDGYLRDLILYYRKPGAISAAKLRKGKDE